MLHIKTLGIFDSGLGGFSVYQDLKKHFPDLNMVMFADQKNAPYGNQSVEAIQAIAYDAIDQFQKRGIDSVLIACNTVSAVALTYLREQFPSMNLWGIIDLTVSQVKADQRVQVVATQATVNSKSYQMAMPMNEVIETAIPQLVTLIETLAEDSVILNELDVCCDDVDVLILGCTHYPLVRHLFEMKTQARIIDSFAPIRQFVKKLYSPDLGKTSIYTSGDVATLKHQISQLFNTEEEVLSWNSSF